MYPFTVVAPNAPHIPRPSLCPPHPASLPMPPIMLTHSQAFISTFLPCTRSTPVNKSIPCHPIPCTCKTPSPNPLSLVATLASLTIILPPSSVPTPPSIPLILSPSQSPPTSLQTSPSHRTLLRVHPPPTHHAQPQSSEPPPSTSQNSPASNPHRTTPLPDISPRAKVATRFPSSRLLRLRLRVRPTALGLFGVGALTSTSVFFRRSENREVDHFPAHARERRAYCSVVCVQIPFCVPERQRLLSGLTNLEQTACLVTPDGMAKAARQAAALIERESGLLEDSRRFMPWMDLFVAENIGEAERRFGAHVEIEQRRVDAIIGRRQESDVGNLKTLGEYGVVTLVVATTAGVDLACYEGVTVVEKLRMALRAIGGLMPGDVAGLELLWVPENAHMKSLTRNKLAAAYPALKVL